VLGFLLAGHDALARMDASEADLGQLVLGALPCDLASTGRRLLMETRVHRWRGGVSAQPGGLPVRDPVATHQVDAERLPGLLIVGDYLFDSTLNGVHRSAELVAGLVGRYVREESREAVGW
jgi:hypothetical protein